MRWRKLGMVFAPEGDRAWMVSHAANPVADHLEGDVFRIYFSCRDRENRSHVGTVDMLLTGHSTRVLDISTVPTLAPGAAGLFDDSGISMGCLVRDGARRWLYYTGWNLGVTVPWRNSIGLAVSAGPGLPFIKVSRAPILDRSDDDPFNLSYPWVLREDGLWRMWYGSNTAWGPSTDHMRHVIKYVESEDGLHWRRPGRVALALEGENETAISRPCVRRGEEAYQMWFCHRSSKYRIGYAVSCDGLNWERQPVGLDVSPSGWDSEEMAYPHVFDHAGTLYMLYNGNNYGRDGFGLAVAEHLSD